MKKILKPKMLWIMLLILLYVIKFPKWLILGSWQMNRRDWGDLSNFVWWYHLYSITSLIIFIIGYGIIYYLGKRTNRVLSILHVVFIVFYILLPVAHYELELVLGALVWIIFIFNLLFSKKEVLIL